MNAATEIYDVFISHSMRDSALADSIKRYLAASGVRCWKAPDDILPGESWPSAITRALAQCRAIVLVWSTHSVTSPEVSKELTLATRNGLTVIPFRIENATPTPEWSYHLANTHWMDAFPGAPERFFPDLYSRLSSLLGEVPGSLVSSGADVTAPKAAKLRGLVLAAVAVLSLILLLAGVVSLLKRADSPSSNQPSLAVGSDVADSTAAQTDAPADAQSFALNSSPPAGLAVPPWQLPEPVLPARASATTSEIQAESPQSTAAADRAPPVVSAGEEVHAVPHAQAAATPGNGNAEKLDGYYRGEFANLKSGQVRDFTIRFTSGVLLADDPPAAEIAAIVAFGDQVDDGLRGTVIYSARTTFSVGWKNETGSMTFVGQAQGGSLEGTWELEPAGGESVNGTFQASKVMEERTQ